MKSVWVSPDSERLSIVTRIHHCPDYGKIFYMWKIKRDYTSSGIGFRLSLMYPAEGGISALRFPDKKLFSKIRVYSKIGI